MKATVFRTNITKENIKTGDQNTSTNLAKNIIHGYSMYTKKEGVGRIKFENWDVLSTREKQNENIVADRSFMIRTEADICAGVTEKKLWHLIIKQNKLHK